MAINDNQPFDDSLQKDRRTNSEDPSTSTSELDPYRQGVELSSAKHYAQGLVKIHNEFSDHNGNHEIPYLTLGQLRTSQTKQTSTTFTERAKYDPTSRLERWFSTDVDSLFEDEIPSADGAMESFTIRDLVTLRTHSSDIVHKVCSFLEEGNTETRDSSDGFVVIVKLSEKNVGSSAYVDTVDTMGSLVVVVESESVDERARGPFNENYLKKGTFASTKIESDMNVALSSMEPGTENMLPDEYVQLGSTGFDY